MKKQSKVTRWIVNGLLVLLFMLGLALVFNNQIRDYLMKDTTKHYELKTVTKKEIQSNQEAAGSFDFDAVKPVSTQAVVEAKFQNEKLPVIGGVAVPSVGINLPIFKGLANTALLYGAGTLDPNQKMGQGNYALASHRMTNPDLLFTPLEKVKKEDVIYLTDLTTVYTYKATKIMRVEPTRVDVLDIQPGKNQLTLITCGEIGGLTRIIVQADLVSETPMDQATSEMTKAFQLDQNIR